MDPQELRDLRSEMRSYFGSVDERLRHLETTSAAIDAKLDHALGRSADHEKRIRAVEKKVWTLSTITSAVGVLLGWAISWFVRHT